MMWKGIKDFICPACGNRMGPKHKFFTKCPRYQTQLVREGFDSSTDIDEPSEDELTDELHDRFDSARDIARAIQEKRLDVKYMLDLSHTDLSPYTNKFAGKDLRGIDVSGSTLKFNNLTGTNFTAAHFNGTKLIDVNLRGANCQGANFTAAHFHKVDLLDVNLSGARFSGATFDRDSCVPVTLLTNPTVDLKALAGTKIAGDADMRVAQEIRLREMRHLATTTNVQHLTDIATVGSPALRAAVAANPRTPVKVLEWLAGDSSLGVRNTVMRNPAASNGIRAAAALTS